MTNTSDEEKIFDINEYGGNIKLSIPRLFVPFNTEKIIPKYMSPSTRISIGATSQRNIGLDKQTLTGAFNYNWYPSKLFMGDSGSLTLGFIIVVLSIHSVQMKYISPVTVILLTAVPILDTLIVMVRRIRKGKNPFHPDKTHIHHIILKMHYNNTAKTTKILILLQSVFIYIGLGFKVRDDLVILIMFILLFILFYSLLTPLKKKYK